MKGNIDEKDSQEKNTCCTERRECFQALAARPQSETSARNYREVLWSSANHACPGCPLPLFITSKAVLKYLLPQRAHNLAGKMTYIKVYMLIFKPGRLQTQGRYYLKQKEIPPKVTWPRRHLLPHRVKSPETGHGLVHSLAASELPSAPGSTSLIFSTFPSWLQDGCCSSGNHRWCQCPESEKEYLYLRFPFKNKWELPRSLSAYLPSSIVGQSCLICPGLKAKKAEGCHHDCWLRPTGLKLWTLDTWGSAWSFQGVRRVKQFRNKSKTSLVFWLCRYLHWWCKSNGGSDWWHLITNQGEGITLHK